MDVKIIQTLDGSSSLFVSSLDETYHSKHGAVQESKHVFIDAGFQLFVNEDTLSILEIGFGTGLNALATWAAIPTTMQVSYTALETFILPEEIVRKLQFDLGNGPADSDNLKLLHGAIWDENVFLNENFSLKKEHCSLQEWSTTDRFHLIYYDAFGPQAQPEMWTKELFAKLFSYLERGGVLVTYCAKGQVRRDMEQCGFTVQRLPGPPGKREMLRALKQ